MKIKLLSALLAAVLLLAAGCGALSDMAGILAPAASPAPSDTPPEEAPTAAATPSLPENEDLFTLGYTMETRTVYFPEDAGEADAQYILSYTLPAFMDSAEPYVSLKSALALYEEELLERVREERLPLADRAEGDPAPQTSVTSEVACVFVSGMRRLWNIRLFETVTYGDETEIIPYVLVLDDSGNEQSFAAVSGQYEPDAIVAQQIFNAIDQDPSAYYADLTPEDVRLALDLMNGFAVTESGYEIFVRPGALAPVEAEVLSFSVPAEALYPDCVGSAVSVAEYEALLPAFSALAAACAPNYEGFFEGSPSAYVASAFLTHLLTTGSEEGYWVEVPAAQYRAAFADYFTGSLPADLAEYGDGTVLVGHNDTYHLPVHPRAAYALRVDDAVREADSLTVYGMHLYGIPGTEEAGELAALVITLAVDGSAPMGFRFVSVELT